MPTQSIKSKVAEAKYRSKIAKQHLGEKGFFPDEPQEKDFAQILNSRLKEYQKTFSILDRQNLIKSPFLEIGAEYCLASTLLVNKFQAFGIASDISPVSLKNAGEFAKRFKFKKLPKIVCADAYSLPFKSATFPFIFTYETLHHFPDPQPPLAEFKRLLAPGGTLLIGQEPIKQSFQLKLWRRPTKLRLWEKILKAILILPFISHVGKTEVDHGILEEAFSLDVWQKALSIFDKVEVTVRAFPFGPSQTLNKTNSKNWLSPSLVCRFAIDAFGGGLQAFCFKSGQLAKNTNDLGDLLICPACSKNQKEITLVNQNQTYSCPNCQNVYPNYQGVPILLEKKLQEAILSKP